MPGAAEPEPAKPALPGRMPVGPFRSSGGWGGLCKRELPPSPQQKGGGGGFPRGFEPSPAAAQLILQHQGAPGRAGSWIRSTHSSTQCSSSSQIPLPGPRPHEASQGRQIPRCTLPMLRIPSSAPSPVHVRGADPSSHPSQLAGKEALSQPGSGRSSSPGSSVIARGRAVLWPG